MKMALLYLLVASAAMFGYPDEREIREALFVSTNYWGRDVEAYKAQVATDSRALARLGTPESFRVRRDYYETLMDRIKGKIENYLGRPIRTKQQLREDHKNHRNVEFLEKEDPHAAP